MAGGEIQFLPMSPAHIGRAIQLWETTDGIVMTDTDNPQDLARYLERNPGVSQVAFDGSDLVGAVLCGHDGRRGYLHHLSVEASYQGRGIGRRLVDGCVANLRAAGIRACNLFVVDDNSQARSFWKYHGWKRWAAIRVMSSVLDAGSS